MKLAILIPSLVWMAAFIIIAGLLYLSNRQQEISPVIRSSMRRLAIGLVMVGASSIPAAIEALSSNGQFGLAGLPLALAGVAVIFWKKQLADEEHIREFTFREQSTAISLILVVLLYGIGSAFALADGGLQSGIAWLVMSTFLLIILMAISHMILAIKHHPEPDDERDQTVALRSARNGYTALCVGVWFCLGMLFIAPDTQAIALSIFGVFVLAEIVRMASSLIYFRFDI